MTLKKFKLAAGIGTKKSDYAGWSYTCIITHFKDNADAGYQNGDLTLKQRNLLVKQGKEMANKFTY